LSSISINTASATAVGDAMFTTMAFVERENGRVSPGILSLGGESGWERGSSTYSPIPKGRKERKRR
jgi:hypothetical protein